MIVGAGISGLSLAYRLQERLPDAHITLLEQADRSGGTTWTLRDDGFLVEMGRNGFLDTKPTTLALCRTWDSDAQAGSGQRSGGQESLFLPRRRSQGLPAGLRHFLRPICSAGEASCRCWGNAFAAAGRPDDESIDAFARRRRGRSRRRLRRRAGDGHLRGRSETAELARLFSAKSGRNWNATTAASSRASPPASEETPRRGEKSGPTLWPPGKMWSFAGGLRTLDRDA